MAVTQNPLISVIIPHYNRVNLLNRLLDTIPVKGIQLIVVDDKSTEDISVIEQRVLSRGGIFIHNMTESKNAGVCRNLGLRQANGKWAVFADSDDEFQEDAFDILRRYADSDADIIYFSPVSKSAQGVSKRHIKYSNLVKEYLALPDKHNETWLRYKFIVPWSKMIRMDLIREHNILFDEIPASNDIMFSMKSAYYARKIEASKECIYCVMEHEGSLTATYDETIGWSRVKADRDRYLFIKEYLDVREFGFWSLSALYTINNLIQRGYHPKFIYEVFRYFHKQGIPLFSLRGFVNSTKWYFMNNKHK